MARCSWLAVATRAAAALAVASIVVHAPAAAMEPPHEGDAAAAAVISTSPDAARALGASVNCQPRSGMNKVDCLTLAAQCARQGTTISWVGTGCGGDGGCQCGAASDYCGWTCKQKCAASPQCRWNGLQCVNKKTGASGSSCSKFQVCEPPGTLSTCLYTSNFPQSGTCKNIGVYCLQSTSNQAIYVDDDTTKSVYNDYKQTCATDADCTLHPNSVCISTLASSTPTKPTCWNGYPKPSVCAVGCVTGGP